MALINFQNIHLGFGSHNLLDGVDIQIHENEKICLLGRNGSGKTSMMKLIHGELPADSGTVLRGKGVRTGLLTQSIPEDVAGSVFSVVAEGLALHGLEEHVAFARIKRTLSLMSLEPELPFEKLSAGMKRRVLLGRALVDEPDVLLLDEPTNHLDVGAVRWLEDFLVRWPKTLFFVTHDRTFLQKVADRIIELDRGKLFDWKCDYRTFLARKEAWLEAEEARNVDFDRKLAQEEIWLRKGIKARRTRNEGRVKSLMKMREERALRRERTGTARIEIGDAGKSGNTVIEAKNVSFAYGNKPLIANLSTLVQRGDKIGILGPNGCGKSTLVRLLLGELSPVSGTVKIGTRLAPLYFDQLRDSLDPEASIRQNVCPNGDTVDINGKARHVIGYLEGFLFDPDALDMKVAALSGGEKNRLLLAKLFSKPSNLIVMDEPTNDLDIETIELLEDLLLNYEGTLLLVSHDRSFLNNVVTNLLAFDENGEIGEYAGGYDDWLVQAKPVEPEEKERSAAARPKRVPDKRKLGFKEKKELERIPGLLEAKEARKHEIFELLANPETHKQGGARVSELKAELESIDKELETLFARWQELESVEAENGI